MHRVLALWWLALGSVRPPGPRAVVAIFRRHRAPRPHPSLDTPYYPARGARGLMLIPKDEYMESVETLLKRTLG
jgi:hypothetical protein